MFSIRIFLDCKASNTGDSILLLAFTSEPEQISNLTISK